MNVFQFSELFQLYPSKVPQKEGEKQQTEEKRMVKEEPKQLPRRSGNLSAGPCLSKSGSSNDLELATSREETIPRHNSNEGWLSAMAHSLQRGQQQAIEVFSMGTGIVEKETSSSQIDFSTKVTKRKAEEEEQRQDVLPESESVTCESESSDITESVNSDGETYPDIEVQLSPSGSSQGTANTSSSAASKRQDVGESDGFEGEDCADIEVQLSLSGSSKGISNSPSTAESEQQIPSDNAVEIGSLPLELGISNQKCGSSSTSQHKSQSAQHTIPTYPGDSPQEGPEEDAEVQQEVPQDETASTTYTSPEEEQLVDHPRDDQLIEGRIPCGKSTGYPTRTCDDSERSENELIQLTASTSREEESVVVPTNKSGEEPKASESTVSADEEASTDSGEDDSSRVEMHVDELARIMDAYTLQNQEGGENDKEHDVDSNTLQGQSESVQSVYEEDVSQSRSQSLNSMEVSMSEADFSRIMNTYSLQNQKQNLDEELHTATNVAMGKVQLEVAVSSPCDSNKEGIDNTLGSDESSGEMEMDAEELARIMNLYTQQDQQQEVDEGGHPAVRDHVQTKETPPVSLQQECLDDEEMGAYDEVHVDPKEFARIMNAYAMQQGLEKPSQESENTPQKETRAVNQTHNKEITCHKSQHAAPGKLRVNCDQNQDNHLDLGSASSDDSGEMEVDMGELARIMQMYDQQTPKQKNQGQDIVPRCTKNGKHDKFKKGTKVESLEPVQLPTESNTVGVDCSSSGLRSSRKSSSEVEERASSMALSEQEKLTTPIEVSVPQDQERCHMKGHEDDSENFSTVEASNRNSYLPRCRQMKKLSRRKGFFPGSDKNDTLIRELTHIQSHGPHIFEAIDEKIQLWRQEETLYQQRVLKNVQKLQDDNDAQPTDGTVLTVESSVADRHPADMVIPSLLQGRGNPPALIRELQHVQCDGPDMLNGIEEKVKAWQNHETQQQQVGHTRAEDLIGSVVPAEVDAAPKNDPYMLSKCATSEHTESTYCCTVSLSSSRRGFRNAGETSRRTSGVTSEAEARDTGETEAKSLHSGDLNNSLSLRTDSELGEWDASACVAALVEEVLNDAAVEPLTKGSDAHDNCIFTEETAYSDELEQPVIDSFDQDDDKHFDFDNLSAVSEESYGFVGHGISDNTSVISELSIPTVVSHCEKDTVPAPTVVLRHVDLSQKRPCFRSEQPMRPNLRRVLPEQNHHQEMAPSAELRRVKSNPNRLSQRLKQLCVADHMLEAQEEGDHQRTSLRRCNSDVQPSDSGSVAFPTGESSILDFSWEELEEVGSAKDEAFLKQFEDLDDTESLSEESTTIFDEITVDSSYEEVTVYDQDDVNESKEAPPVPVKTLGTTSIKKPDSFYNSVSVSFLASSIADNVVLEVLGEALRILRGGGNLNILDLNGAIVERLKNFPRLQCLAFQRATFKDQERIGADTMSILEKSGLKSSIHANDPRIIHWAATKPEAA